MDVKERLNEAWYCHQQIQAQLDDIERLRSLAERVTSTISPTAGCSGGTGDRIPNAVARIIELEESVADSIAELREARENVERYINDSFPPGVTRVVLYRRYILMQRWERIATDMCYSIKWIWKLHSRALRTLEELKEAGESD